MEEELGRRGGSFRGYVYHGSTMWAIEVQAWGVNQRWNMYRTYLTFEDEVQDTR